MTKKYLKVVINTLFLIAVFVATAYIVFKDQEIGAVIDSIHRAKKSYIILGMMLSIAFVCSESLIIHYLMHTIRQGVSIVRCIIYSFVGFFFSAVTPSATGGQPMQVVWMRRDGISVAVSSFVLMIVTAAYKTVLIIMCAIAAIFEWNFISSYASSIWFLIIIGIICNVSFVLFLVFALFRQSWLTDTIGKVIFWLGKHRIIKNREKWLKKAWKSLSKYDKSADYIKQNKPVLVHVFLMTIFQRLCLFAVTYVVYRAFGLHNASAVQIISLQTIIALAVDSLPLPGAMGASESSFLIIFLTVFGEEFVLPGMLLSRGITYYAMIIVSAVITLVSYLLVSRKKNLESGGL
ncbi:MAG: lysylphosphatidylglycerol synthase transmembrane domain-containing protein [Clostridiales bacterium]|nr:lysylphosphatidylglycerol synthase transmembrane domain-containing protein [Clostridiales bacterium]